MITERKAIKKKERNMLNMGSERTCACLLWRDLYLSPHQAQLWIITVKCMIVIKLSIQKEKKSLELNCKELLSSVCFSVRESTEKLQVLLEICFITEWESH